jgi:hypothetical protein
MLHAHEKCSEPIHLFLDLIHESMLVVEGQDLDSNDIKRAPCSKIHEALDNIFKMISNPSFRLVASPWGQPRLRVPDPVEADLNSDAKPAALLRKAELRRHEGRTRQKSTTWPNSKHSGQNSR